MITLEVILTVSAIVVAVAVAGWMILLERREPIPGQPRLISTTPVLFLAILVLVLALAHMATLITGKPRLGRLG